MILKKIYALMNMSHSYSGWMFRVTENGYKCHIGHLGQPFKETYKQALLWQLDQHPNQIVSRELRAMADK